MMKMIEQQTALNTCEQPKLTTPLLLKKSNEKQINILLVEDVSSDMLLTKLALQATNIPFHLETIRRGDEALNSLQFSHICNPSNLPDLIMLDLGLPGMDGFEMLDTIAQMPANVRAVPIVILTAHKHFEYIKDSYALCVIDYINKPCCTDKLKEILRDVQRSRLNTIKD